ncbi:MAG TPA: hypothetical protein VLD85_12040 [Anaeromyxobacteraceae bacterium]|nr:hypothetical protein [Anaeromyxobacteraceae bacterium]
MRARALAPVLLALLSCGGFSADVEVERFCFTQRVTNLPPAVAGTLPLLPPYAVPLQVPPLLKKDGAHATVRLLDARVVPTAGEDLAGISSFVLSLQPASGTPVVVASYTRPSPPPATVPQIVLAGTGVDVVPLLQGGNLQVVVSGAASGPPPAGFWDADLQVCFHGKADFPYL